VLGGTKVYYSTKNRFVVYWNKEPVMVSTVMVIAVVLGTAFLFNELFKKLKLPPVVGQIIGGLILGIPILKSIIFQSSVDFPAFQSDFEGASKS
jgi:hypothetical protein